MPRLGIHHVDIVVSSLERSLPFYRELLEPLGYVRAGEVRGERGEPIWYLHGDSVGVSLGLRELQSPGEHDRYAVGLHHLAFEASSRELVDDRYRWALAQGLRDRERAAGVDVRPRLLRDVLPRPRWDQARGRPRALIRACRQGAHRRRTR